MAQSWVMWPQTWHLKHWRELGSFLFEVPLCAWSLASSNENPCATSGRCTVDWCGLSQTSLAIIRAGTARSAPVHLSPPMASLSGDIWGTGRAVALSCCGQCSHQLGYLVPKLCSVLYRFSGHGWPSPYLVTGFFIFTLCLANSNHQLGIGGPRLAIEISYWISNMFVDPMEETIFEMLLHLLTWHPPRALQLDLIKGPFQPHGKRGNLLMVTLHNFIKILHYDIEWCHSSKDYDWFL